MTDAAIAKLAPVLGTRAACRAVGRPQATHYRRHRSSPPPARPAPVPPADRVQPQVLSAHERQRILDVCHEPRFVDASPAQVWATLLDEGVYLGSQSTFYRLLRSVGEVRERRRQATHPARVKPELMATGPNQVYSWDITKLLGPKKWTYYYLYVILDVFSRYAVGWMVATKESAALAEKLISHSRPRVSNDNPYSEAQFKTLKYRPNFPRQFDSIEGARAHCREFFAYYNEVHRHSGLGLHTPADVHHGHAPAVQAQRARVLTAAYDAHPERFVHRPPTLTALPSVAWINPPATNSSDPDNTEAAAG